MKNEIISFEGEEKTLLLHSCCAPCSSSVIEKLEKHFKITVFFFNPNIKPKEEYEKRKTELKIFLKEKNIDFLEGEYNNQVFENAIQNFECAPEKSERCYCCYDMRILETSKKAQEMKFDYFTTTLSVSPHKVSSWINEIGEKYSTSNCKFLCSDFKKDNGFLRSLEISKQQIFYRQAYCGCRPN